MKDQIYRSPINRVIGGVCSGLGIYFNIDPILIRVIFILLFIFKGIGILLYIILWIILPERYPESYQEYMGAEPESGKEKSADKTEMHDFTTVKQNGSAGKTVIGIILIGIGVIFFLERYLPNFDFEDFFPLIFIIIGVSLIWNSFKNKN